MAATRTAQAAMSSVLPVIIVWDIILEEEGKKKLSVAWHYSLKHKIPAQMLSCKSYEYSYVSCVKEVFLHHFQMMRKPAYNTSVKRKGKMKCLGRK